MDDTQRARELVKDLRGRYDFIDLEILEGRIVEALTQARREGMEEAASLCRQAMLFGMAQTISEKAKG